MINDAIKKLCGQSSRAARAGLVAGLVLIIGFFVAAALWVSTRDYQVLFSNLAPQDAAAMVAELDRMKVPYTLDANGTTILVEREQVHKTRLKLMGRDVPLNGAVGFELFNNSDFSMSEFAQKVNYQRALQGEITRTILSIDGIKSARVHLALPEEGLFKRAQHKPKASITVVMKPGHVLEAAQVAGIARLVAAAVPGVNAADVTIVDNNGVALTRANDGEAGAADSGRLELKKETEGYLARKATAVLERSFGAGQAIASVDVVLNMDQVKTTTEEVIAAPNAAGKSATGVVVREKESLRDAPAPLEGAPRGGSQSQRETEYQVGRRVEQVVSQPGSIRRVQVVAVVKAKLDEAAREELKAALGAAVGASGERGDAIIVQTLGAAVVDESAGSVAAESPAATPSRESDSRFALWVIGALAAGLGLGLVVMVLSRGSRSAGLSAREHEALASRINQWLALGGEAPKDSRSEGAARS